MTVYLSSIEGRYEKVEKHVKRVEFFGTHIHCIYEDGVYGIVESVSYDATEMMVQAIEE